MNRDFLGIILYSIFIITCVVFAKEKTFLFAGNSQLSYFIVKGGQKYFHEKAEEIYRDTVKEICLAKVSTPIAEMKKGNSTFERFLKAVQGKGVAALILFYGVMESEKYDLAETFTCEIDRFVNDVEQATDQTFPVFICRTENNSRDFKSGKRKYCRIVDSILIQYTTYKENRILFPEDYISATMYGDALHYNLEGYKMCSDFILSKLVEVGK